MLDALVRSEVLLSAVPMSPGPLSTATSGTELALAVPLQRRHATLGELRTGTFDFCAPRLAVVVDSVVTTCTGDVILKLVVSRLLYIFHAIFSFLLLSG
jgi:hypothetical protein